MAGSEQPETGSGDRRGRGRLLGCVFLLLAVLVVVAVLVWIDSQQTREPPHNAIAPVQAPPPA